MSRGVCQLIPLLLLLFHLSVLVVACSGRCLSRQDGEGEGGEWRVGGLLAPDTTGVLEAWQAEYKSCSVIPQALNLLTTLPLR